MGDKKLSKAVSFTDDIKPYAFIQIYAGVGSGKNYYIEQLIKGHTDERKDGTCVEVEPQTVLLITSRRSKVDEMLTEDDLEIDGTVGRWDEFHIVLDDNGEPVTPLGKLRVLQDDWGPRKVYQRSVVCTNAFIEKYLQYRYNPRDITTHLWELFDIIVIDEAHSLVLDATYQSAPFYVRELIKLYNGMVGWHLKNPKKYKRPQCKHIILMTGTVDPIENFKAPKNSVILNKMGECENVVPQNIYFVTVEDVKKQIETQLADGEKVMYFTNHVVLPAEFCKDTAILPEHVAVSFSKKSAREDLKKEDPDTYDTMVRVEESLKKHSLIPDDIKLFITTGRNKEGINIANKDIQHLYVESHVRSDVVQMAGRIRCGVENMYVVIDAKGHNNTEWHHEADFCRMKLAGNASKPADVCGVANEYLKELCEKHRIEGLYKYGVSTAMTTAYSRGCEEIAQFINYVHEKFPYVRYDYFHNVFEYYSFRHIGMKYMRENCALFAAAKDDTSRYQKILQKWFPTSEVFPFVTFDEAAKKYFSDNVVVGKQENYTESDIERIVADLQRIYRTEVKQINRLLSRFCAYECVRHGNEPKRPSYHRFYFRHQ